MVHGRCFVLMIWCYLQNQKRPRQLHYFDEIKGNGMLVKKYGKVQVDGNWKERRKDLISKMAMWLLCKSSGSVLCTIQLQIAINGFKLYVKV